MPFEVVLPRLGWNMERGSLGQWLKASGDRVEAGEFIFTVEGDKATQEVEAPERGVLHIPEDSPPPGREVPVGTVLGYILKPGEAPPGAASQAAEPPGAPGKAAAPSGEPGKASAAGPQLAEIGSGPRHRISPRARRVAGELGVDWRRLSGSGRTGRVVERDVRRAAALLQQAPVAERVAPTSASPLARRLAEEVGVDLEALAAKLPGRRIERADVEAAAAARAARVTVAPSRPGFPSGAELPISTTRRTIAERMAGSAQTTAAVTLTTEADATELVRLRTQLKEGGAQPLPSYNDLLAKLVSAALTEHPAVNSRFEGHSIVQPATVNVGIAVDTDRGLLVPVVRDVQAKSLRQIARESAELVEKARAGRIAVDDLRGGTFTITNLGMYEIDGFTPIINLPECAILGVGRIVPKQVVVDPANERLAIRHMVVLSLTFDHRLVDGAPAARFLQRVKQYIERPNLWLVG